MKTGTIGRAVRALGVVAMLAAASTAWADNLLINGDFETAPFLGAGQTGVSIGFTKPISTDPSDPNYSNSISGIAGWTYATPLWNGTASDHGLVRREGSFGRPVNGQAAFINNWERMMSQTVAPTFGVGDVLTASVDFGTMGDDTDLGRAGRFYLVAGEADPANLDQFSARSVVLGQLSVANPSWTGFTPDVVVGNWLYTHLEISHTVTAADLRGGLPLTIAFKTVGSSVGPTVWDNASLSVRSVPEPSTMALVGVAAASLAGLAAIRRRGIVRD